MCLWADLLRRCYIELELRMLSYSWSPWKVHPTSLLMSKRGWPGLMLAQRILPFFPQRIQKTGKKSSLQWNNTMHEPFWERLKKRKHWQRSQEQRQWGTTMHSQNTSDLIMTPIICFILWSSYSSCTATNSHAVKLLAKDMRNAHILLNMDNRIAIFYMNQMGRTHSPIVSRQPSNSALAMVPGEEPISAEHLPE